jgi:hypothetical protein
MTTEQNTELNKTVEIEHSVLLEMIHALKHPFTTIHKIVNMSLSVLIITGAIIISYGLYKSNKIAEKSADQIELFNKYHVVQNQQTLLLTIVDEHLRDSASAKLGSAPLEEKVATAKIMYDLSVAKRVPLSLIVGIADVESGWNTHAVRSASCLGILQVTPLYARPYLRENRIDYKQDIYFDPVVCCIVGIGMLNDFQNIKIEAGLATQDNWNFAVHDYFWGPAKRNNILDMNYSLKVIEAMKRYQKMGLS